MKLYYYKDVHGNFGDDLNPWLWSKLIPSIIDDNEEEIFVGIGTLLNDKIPSHPAKVVFGTGAGYGHTLPEIDNKWKFYCVRGPLTASKLGLSKMYAITDAAALVPAVYKNDHQERLTAAFIPHHYSAWHLDWASICHEIGITYIDPRNDVDTVLNEIYKSSFIITEAMHGAILADSFRIPWMPVILYDHILQSKWQDWTQSISVPYEPYRLNGVWNSDYNYSISDRFKINIKRLLNKSGINSESWTPPPRKSSNKEIDLFIKEFNTMIRLQKYQLSNDSIFDTASSRLLEKLDDLKRDRGILR